MTRLRALPLLLACVITLNQHWNKASDSPLVIDGDSDNVTVDFGHRTIGEMPFQIKLRDCRDTTIVLAPDAHPEWRSP